MTKTLALLLALTTAMPAAAGGVVIVEDAYETEATQKRGGWIVPAVIGALVVCAIACGNDDAPPAVVPGPICNGNEGC